MKRLLAILLAGTLALAAGTQAQPGIGPVCTGEFPNLITDVCYDCMFPISLAGSLINIGVSNDDYDSDAGHLPVCGCINSLTLGTPTSFWEPTFMVDVTNKPGCMPLLSAVDITPPYNDLEYGGEKRSGSKSGAQNRQGFMHVNEYVNPVMTTLGVISDSPCLDSRGFDTPFVSWADPTWNDDALSMILTPYAYAFAGIASIAAEASDAIAAAAGFPIASLFWVAGGWGPMYPVTGNVAANNTPEQVGHLLIARLFAKLHAAGVQQSTAGADALKSCGAVGIPQFLMDKRQYKTNRVFPFPDNMCTPFGRPLMLQEKGAARPQDKDYGYFIFRKKDCCAPVYSPL